MPDLSILQYVIPNGCSQFGRDNGSKIAVDKEIRQSTRAAEVGLLEGGVVRRDPRPTQLVLGSEDDAVSRTSEMELPHLVTLVLVLTFGNRDFDARSVRHADGDEADKPNDRIVGFDKDQAASCDIREGRL